jgi:hypothetical protein
MGDALGSDTVAPGTKEEPEPSASPPVREAPLWPALAFIGIAIVSAGVVYAVVRATFARPPADPTTERIQSLIDEANRLLKTLDDQKRA